MAETKYIATHNSGTGEPSAGFINSILTVFARCQTKSLTKQVWRGVTLFDLRVRYNSKGQLVIAHGLWESSTSAKSALAIMSNIHLAKSYINKEYADSFPALKVGVTYEGKLQDTESFISEIKSYTPDNIAIPYIAVKKPRWETIVGSFNVYFVRDFVVLESNWRMLIPIPYLWHLLYRRKHNKDLNKFYVMYDFI